MDRSHASPHGRPPAGPAPDAAPLLDRAGTPAPTGEFLCPGCRRPLAIALRSDLGFGEAQVYCPDCERDYQQRRGRWAE